jgi:hypothetical protein
MKYLTWKKLFILLHLIPVGVLLCCVHILMFISKKAYKGIHIVGEILSRYVHKCLPK